LRSALIETAKSKERQEKEESDQAKRERKDEFSCVKHTCDRSERAKSEQTAPPESTSIGFHILERYTGEKRKRSMNKEI
jgi:hypothetical protein